jgi:hypothetical protein
MKTTVKIEIEIPHPDGALPVEVWGVVTETRDRCDTDRGVQELVEYEAVWSFVHAHPYELSLNAGEWINANLDTVEQKLIEEYKNQPERA